MVSRTLTQATSTVLASSQCSFKIKNTLVSLSSTDNEFFKINKLKGLSTKYLILVSADLNRYNPSLNSNLVSTKGYPVSAYSKGWKLTASMKKTWFFWKLKYHGKGLKIKKSSPQSQMLFNLGSSHVSKLLFKNELIEIYRTKKNTYTAISAFKRNLVKHSLIYRIRPYNKYTKRGMRLTKQPVKRRFGKVSQLLPKKNKK